jgi:hypothetical protein
MRCEERTLDDDIRALGGNDAEDERRFAAAAKVSEINLAVYRTFLQPYVRAKLSPPVSELIEKLHPLRLPYETLSDDNPLMAPVIAMANEVPKRRQPRIIRSSRFRSRRRARWVAALDAWRDIRDAISESLFLTVYGSPLLQAAPGIDPADTRRPRLSTSWRMPGLRRSGRKSRKAHPRSGGARLDLHSHAASCGRRAGVPSDPPPAGLPS